MSHRSKKSPTESPQRQLTFESLEDRRMLAVFSVGNLNDSGAGSLRDAITQANANGVADEITFSVTGTIDLASQLPTIAEELTITGPGAALLTLDAGDGTDNTFDTNDGYRIFNIDDGNSGNTIDVSLSGLTLTGGDGSADGGAIRNRENLTVTGSSISGNATSGYGGGFFSRSGTLTISNSTINGNSASYGGGISYHAGTLTVSDSTISGNSSSNEGGGFFSGGFYGGGTLTLSNSTVSGNSSGSDGGGFYGAGTLTLNNSTVSGNSSSDEGGGISISGTLNVRNSTISGNTATHGGGINTYYATVTLSNSIVAQNTASLSGPDIRRDSGSLGGTFNLIGDGSGFTGITNGIGGNQVGTGGSPIDPLLGLLADNGGPTFTHALLLGSPALDAGDPSFATPPDFDQRGAGFVRVENGGVNGVRIDIGAFEQQPLNLVVDTTSDIDNSDFSTGNFSLREAIGLANLGSGVVTITFSPLFDTPQTIDLASQLPTITGNLTITGPGAALLTLDAGDGTDNTFATQDGYRIFVIDDGVGGNEIDVTLSDLTLTGGDASANGGAIRSSENLTVARSTFSGNSAAFGGALYANGTTSIDSSTISGNSATGGGGGIYSNSTLNVTGSIISGNSAAGNGGGIAGTATVSSSTITGNSAYLGGGLYATDTTSIDNSTISGNSATDIGGGIYNSSATINITNSTVSGNSAISGGGIVNAGTLIVSNSTFTGNSATIRGGGLFEMSSSTIDNTIIAQNTAGTSGPDIENLTSITGTFNLIGDGTGQSALVDGVGGNQVGTSGSPIDALLGPLADNGGSTFTHALLAASPAIGKGDPFFDPNAFTPPLAEDQRGVGFDRIRGIVIDVGAVERQDVVFPGLEVDTVVDLVNGDFSAGDLSLREAILIAGIIPGADTITFGSLFDTVQTIDLASQLPTIAEELTITGPGALLLTLDAGDGTDNTFDTQDGYRIFNIDDGINGNTIDVSLIGLTLTGSDSSGDGGAIRNRENLTVTGSTISGNATNGNGGGIEESQGTLNISGSTISGNSSGVGGGIVTYGTATISNSTISGNSATAHGGGIVYYGATLNISGSTISGNSSNSYGGGFSSGSFIGGSAVNIDNSTISENTAVGDGGGFYSNNNTVTINNSTVTGNSASTGGGFSVYDGSLTLNNTIVAQNTASSSDPDIENDSSSVSGAFNLIGDGTGSGIFNGVSGNQVGTSGSPIDALLGPLASNGGPTETHALLPSSPAIDAGDSSIVFNPAEFDQRGAAFARVVGGRIDVGSVEDQTFPDSADFDTDGDVDGGDFLAWQRGFGTPTPNATQGDGDADNDTDVDGNDLSLWQAQFGGVAPILAFSTASPEPIVLEAASGTQISEPASPANNPATFIDAVMAMERFGLQTEEEETARATKTIAVEAAFTGEPETDWLAAGGNLITRFGTSNANSEEETAEDTGSDEPWLAKEMLERVFSVLPVDPLF